MKAVKQQAREQGSDWPPFRAGLFGSPERFEKIVEGFEETLQISRWLR